MLSERNVWVNLPRWRELKDKVQLTCPECSSNHVSPRTYDFHTLRDLSLDIPTRIHVETVWYMCHDCKHIFRGVDPEGVSPYTQFTDRVHETLRKSYVDDNLSSRQVSKRMARDFHISVSRETVRRASKKAEPASKIPLTCSGVLAIDGFYVKVRGEKRVIIIIVDVIWKKPLLTEMHLEEDQDAMRSALTTLKEQCH